MRSEIEKQLAVLSLLKDRETCPQTSFFGDNNHTIIDYSIKAIKGEIDEDEIFQLEDDGDLTETERSSISDIFTWLDNSSESIADLLFDSNNLVTELPDTNKNIVTFCAKTCKECPFSNTSLNGWLADYTFEDIQAMMATEKSFPCHMQLSENNLTFEEAEKAINDGKIKLCRGYVECIIKSAKSPYKNKQLVDAIAKVKAEGLSDNTMSIIEFRQHHNKFKQND